MEGKPGTGQLADSSPDGDPGVGEEDLMGEKAEHFRGK